MMKEGRKRVLLWCLSAICFKYEFSVSRSRVGSCLFGKEYESICHIQKCSKCLARGARHFTLFFFGSVPTAPTYHTIVG